MSFHWGIETIDKELLLTYVLIPVILCFLTSLLIHFPVIIYLFSETSLLYLSFSLDWGITYIIFYTVCSVVINPFNLFWKYFISPLIIT